MEAQCLANVRARWRRRLRRWVRNRSTDDRLIAILLRLDVVAGPFAHEDAAAFNSRLWEYFHLILRRSDVVGRLQEECQPGNDPGDDEDG